MPSLQEPFYNSCSWAWPASRDENEPEGSVSEGDAQSCQEQEPVNRLLGVPRRTGRCRAPSWAARRSVCQRSRHPTDLR
jgi:hypothetical protein